jgi:hypothetical protein
MIEQPMTALGCGEINVMSDFDPVLPRGNGQVPGG